MTENRSARRATLFILAHLVVTLLPFKQPFPLHQYGSLLIRIHSRYLILPSRLWERQIVHSGSFCPEFH
jgi:hypothetical protein